MNNWDWCDHEKVKNFNKKGSIQMRNLVKKISEARAKGSEQEIKKSYSNFKKQQKQEEVYRKKSEEIGYCWV